MLIFYKDYFNDFFDNLAEKVKVKIDEMPYRIIVFWKKDHEATKGIKSLLKTFEEYRIHLITNYPNAVVIVNNLCMEFWFLPYFEKTSKHFDSSSSAEKEQKNIRIITKKTPK